MMQKQADIIPLEVTALRRAIDELEARMGDKVVNAPSASNRQVKRNNRQQKMVDNFLKYNKHKI